MSTVILIRHARSTANAANILAGQTPGVRLDPTGIEQSHSLAEALGELPISKIFISPLERCYATIDPWIHRFGAAVEIQSENRLIEPDYGLWSGRNLDELRHENLWNEIQNDPESVTFPQGERFKDVWDRVAEFYKSLRMLTDEKRNFLVVTHGDIIKMLVAQILEIEFSKFQKLVVEPASMTITKISPDNSRLLQFNRSHAPIASMLDHADGPTLGGENSSIVGGTKNA